MTRRLRTGYYCPFPYHLHLHGQHTQKSYARQVSKENFIKEKEIQGTDGVAQQRALKEKEEKYDLLEQSQRL